MSRPFLSEPFVTQQPSATVINYITDTRNSSQQNTDESYTITIFSRITWSYIKAKLGKFSNMNIDQELFSEICYHIILIEFDIECEKKRIITTTYSPPAFVNVININHVFKRKLIVKGEFITDQSLDPKILPTKKSVMLCSGEIDSLHSHRFSYYDINYRVVYIIYN